jgi:hypothetical protein
LVIEKALDTTWHPGLLHKLSELQFSTSLLKLIASFLNNRKFKVSVEGELSSARKVAAGVPQGSVHAPVLYSLYINDAPVAPGTHLALFADDTCLYATGKDERRQQIPAWPHCYGVMVSALKYKDQRREDSGDLFL